jgi:hypothetical protein
VRRAREPFAMFPHRFIDAEMRGDLSDRQAKLCRFVVQHASQNTNRASLTLEQIATGTRWQRSRDTLMRELKSLRPLWLDFDSRPGQRGPYTFILTGLAVIRETDGEPQPPHDLRKNTPISAEVELPHAEVPGAASNHSQSRESPPQEPPQTTDVLSSLTSSEGSEVKAASEEKLDQAVGGTTGVEIDMRVESEPEFPPLLDLVEPNPFHEQGQVLSDEEMSEIGTASLAELHRRHERGEF